MVVNETDDAKFVTKQSLLWEPRHRRTVLCDDVCLVCRLLVFHE
jgi:hypothetical protein